MADVRASGQRRTADLHVVEVGTVGLQHRAVPQMHAAREQGLGGGQIRDHFNPDRGSAEAGLDDIGAVKSDRLRRGRQRHPGQRGDARRLHDAAEGQLVQPQSGRRHARTGVGARRRRSRQPAGSRPRPVPRGSRPPPHRMTAPSVWRTARRFASKPPPSPSVRRSGWLLWAPRPRRQWLPTRHRWRTTRWSWTSRARARCAHPVAVHGRPAVRSAR